MPERVVDDLDLLLDPSPDNASRVLEALQSLPSVNCRFSSVDLQKPKAQIQLKHLNYYADLLTPDSNTDFAAQWESASVGRVNKVPVRIASREYLITMKTQGHGRKDEDDLRLLDPERPC